MKFSIVIILTLASADHVIAGRESDHLSTKNETLKITADATYAISAKSSRLHMGQVTATISNNETRSFWDAKHASDSPAKKQAFLILNPLILSQFEVTARRLTPEGKTFEEIDIRYSVCGISLNDGNRLISYTGDILMQDTKVITAQEQGSVYARAYSDRNSSQHIFEVGVVSTQCTGDDCYTYLSAK